MDVIDELGYISSQFLNGETTVEEYWNKLAVLIASKTLDKDDLAWIADRLSSD